jgi:hypothetical protein
MTLPPSPERDARIRAPVLERVMLALLLATTLAYWAIQYKPFLLPHNDYYSFEETARAFGRAELPRQFKRMPVFPALVAAVAPAMPEPHRELHAALMVNAGLSLLSLALLFRLASRAFGRGAIALPVLFAATPQLHVMGLQPLVEPSLACWTVLAFVLFQARSPWQYAAAAAMALARFEGASLIPILFLWNAREDGRWLRHGLLAAAAGGALLFWMGLGAAFGSGGGSWYLKLMEEMGWQPAPRFAWREFTESFGVLASAPAIALPAAIAVAIPLVAGVREALRCCRREALVMGAFFAVCVAVIAVFGIDKARYTLPTLWIPLFFASLGLARLTRWAPEWLAARLPTGAAVPVASLAALAWVGVVVAGLRRLAGVPATMPFPLVDVAYAGICLGILALPALWHARRGAWQLASTLAVLAFATALVSSGLARKRVLLHKVYWTNTGSYLLANWLDSNLPPDGRVVLLGKGHVTHLTDIEKPRLVSFSKTGSENADELAAWMREHDFGWVAYTHRKPARNPSAEYYYRNLRVALSEEFRDGSAVPGFRHVATLPVPDAADETAVQIYRRAP